MDIPLLKSREMSFCLEGLVQLTIQPFTNLVAPLAYVAGQH